MTGTDRQLGALRHLAGTWNGAGLHVGFWLDETDEQPGDASARRTCETVSFAQLAIPSSEPDPGEAPFPGVYFLRRANDPRDGARVHAESGTWLPAAEDTRQPDPFEILCLSRTAGNEPTAAVGRCRIAAGEPALRPHTITPQGDVKHLSAPLHRRLQSLADMPTPSRVSRADAEDPHSLLRRHLASIAVTRSVELSASSTAADAMGEALRSSGLALKAANTPHVELGLWLLRTADATSGYDQLLLSRSFMREADGVRWPQVSVAVLHRSDAPSR